MRDAAAARAGCGPCEPFRAVGPGWAIDFRATHATKLGRGDKDSTLRVFRARHGTCCLEREQRFSPGNYLWWTDPARGVIYVRGYDGRWAAWVTDGIWEVDVRSGAKKQVLFGIANEFRCPSDNNKYAFLSRESDPKGTRRQFDAAPFSLVTVERVQGKSLAPVVVSNEPGLSRYYADSDERTRREATRRFHWSKGCSKLIIESRR